MGTNQSTVMRVIARSDVPYKVCRVCKLTPVKDGDIKKKYDYAVPRHICVACDILNGETHSFVRDQKYENLAKCNHCHIMLMTRTYDTVSSIDMCDGCWKMFNRV